LSTTGRTFIIDLHIGADEFLRHYSGAAHTVVVRARSGHMIRFPANALRPFVLHKGVHGIFTLLIDEKNKLLSIKRVDELNQK